MMLLPDGSTLMHGDVPYDSAKAHAYYVRHRKLHPRQHQAAGTYTVKTTNGKTFKLSSRQLEEQKVYAAARVTQIKKNLSDLGVLLRDKMQKAKEAEKNAAKPPTLAEKAQAARDAEKYRASHKQTLSNKAKTAASKSSGSSTPSKPAAKADTVDSLKKDIAATKKGLKDAVAKQRELATAKKSG